MQSRLSRSLTRILLAGCVLGAGATFVLAQSSSPSAPSQPSASRWDIFTGYSYIAPKGTVTTTMGSCGPGAIINGGGSGPSEGVTSFIDPVAEQGGVNPDGAPCNTTLSGQPSAVDAGAIGSVAYYFNRHVGGQIEYANHPDGRNDGLQTIQGGIIFRFPIASEGIEPFIHGLAGATRFGGPNDEPFYAHDYTWGPALTAGGGLDYALPWFNHHLSLRLFQADYEYMHVNYGPEPIFGGRLNSNAARLSTGLVWHLGSIVPPPPVTYACVASPDSVYPGSPVTITGTADNLNASKTATYSWSGEGAAGDSNSTTIQTSNLAPGTYTIHGHVSEGNKAGQSADCNAQFTVKPYEPPTVSCVANPTTVTAGETSTITATGVSPQNLPLTYSYQTSGGTISGTGDTATLSTTGAPAGTITVTCNVSDNKGQTASSTTAVDVAAPPAPVAKTQTLCSIQFNHDRRRPTRVDNDAKACLDDVALNAQRNPDATLVLVGNSAPVSRWDSRHGITAEREAAQRAVNTKEYLVNQKGIDASRISVRTGTSGANEVDNYLVPSGANFENDVPGTTAVDTSAVHAVPRNGRVRHHIHHHIHHVIVHHFHHHKAPATPAQQ